MPDLDLMKQGKQGAQDRRGRARPHHPCRGSRNIPDDRKLSPRNQRRRCGNWRKARQRAVKILMRRRFALAESPSPAVRERGGQALEGLMGEKSQIARSSGARCRPPPLSGCSRSMRDSELDHFRERFTGYFIDYQRRTAFSGSGDLLQNPLAASALAAIAVFSVPLFAASVRGVDEDQAAGVPQSGYDRRDRPAGQIEGSDEGPLFAEV